MQIQEAIEYQLMPSVADMKGLFQSILRLAGDDKEIIALARMGAEIGDDLLNELDVVQESFS